ncbi:LacI family DNA-binding transcriptional regulator [Rothia sp. ZJ932]|uniref:LacI family DNA-binding transcriptional regulator n=1 Tax=Rothia sp. ZJ932 TaxID=2810516 RepID=UPI0019678DB5|nr:LacI family DNA-binding transcriptional regulator [Rothia sp. ZJ932]QRZ62052.1 LacI family DNA-binding transcriptional regulator [Rothia sp. ZJ932]
MAHPKLHDVAALACVSVTTVSRVLNNRGYLSEATKNKVFAAIEELDYRPNAIARSLQNQRTNLIALIFPTMVNPFYGEIATHLERTLSARNYRVVLCNSQGHPAREERYLEMLRARQVDGIITGAHSEVIATYPKLDAPLVTIDREQTDKYPNIRCDNYGAAQQVTKMLIESGAQSIVHIASTISATNERQRGYTEQILAAGYEPQILEVGFTTESERKRHLIEEYLNEHPDVDAVFASNDVYAAHTLSWAQKNGVKVPEDLQIIGFDGTEALRTLFPHLATVVQPLEAIAQRAADHLIAAIENQPLDTDASLDVLKADILMGKTLRK